MNLFLPSKPLRCAFQVCLEVGRLQKRSTAQYLAHDTVFWVWGECFTVHQTHQGPHESDPRKAHFYCLLQWAKDSPGICRVRLSLVQVVPFPTLSLGAHTASSSRIWMEMELPALFMTAVFNTPCYISKFKWVCTSPVQSPEGEPTQFMHDCAPFPSELSAGFHRYVTHLEQMWEN